MLKFDNAAVQYGFEQPPASYNAAWFAFDNRTGAAKPLGESKGPATGLRARAGCQLPLEHSSRWC